MVASASKNKACQRIRAKARNIIVTQGFSPDIKPEGLSYTSKVVSRPDVYRGEVSPAERRADSEFSALSVKIVFTL